MNEERPIEKLLRRYAQKRRDEAGPPPELHPATRRLLQGEVARQFPKARPASRAGFWALLRARWVYAAAGASVVVVGVLLLLPSLREQQHVLPLAKQEQEMSLARATTLSDEKISEELLKRTALEKKESSTIAPAPVAAPAVAVDAAAPAVADPRPEAATQPSLDAGAARRLQEPQTVALSPRPQPADQFKSDRETPAPTTARADVNRVSRGQPQSGPATTLAPVPPERKAAPVGLAGASRDYTVPGKDLVVAENRPAATPARAPASAASEVRSRKTAPSPGGGVERDDRAPVSQSFANLAFAPAEDQKQKGVPPEPVLVNFRIEQNGDQWRVIDGDGSTYLGVSAPGGEITGRVADKDLPAAADESARRAFSQRDGLRANIQSAGKYFHRVEGTNRTLQQPVAFEWNFIAPTNVSGAVTQSVRGAVQAMPAAPWVNSAVNGQVQINAGRELEIRAVPVTK